MTTVEVLYRYAQHPTEAVMRALGSIREVYGIRKIRFDEAAKTVRVEYDATRLATATVLRLIQSTGLEIVEEISLIPPQEKAPTVGVAVAAATA